jgi:hypothetical protein
MSLSLPAQALKVSSWLLVDVRYCVKILVEILLRLAHVRVKVVEIPQLLRSESRIRISGIVSLVMLNVYENVVLFC